MKKIILSGAIILVACSSLIAQEKLANTLLWRISGKGLSNPSYLYGTMHLNDKRLFNFGDSVYQAIQSTEGLAIEVNPDEMIAYYVNKAIADKLDSRRLKDVVDRGAYEKYSKQLSKKLNKPAKDITVADIVQEKNKWMSDIMEEGEMQTFVDAYLYNIAKKQAKWVGGIEDLADQTGLVDDMVDVSDLETIGLNTSRESEKQLDKWIGMYTRQDISEMYNQVNGQENADLILNRRNIKMARRMDSLAAIRTMFFAVGAAHLAGDSGVIKLLRDRGFTVQPVISSSSKPAKEYTFKEIELPWVTVTDANNLYEVSMPGKSTHIKLYGIMDIEFQIDLFNLNTYMSMAIPSNIPPSRHDSLYQDLGERLFNSKQKVTRKDIIVNGTPGVEILSNKENNNARYRIFIKDQFVYVLGFYKARKETKMNGDAEKFMQSIQIHGLSALERQPALYTDSSMAFSFLSPVPLENNEQMAKNSALPDSKVEVKTGVDLRSGSYIMVITRKTQPGYHLVPEKIMEAFKKNMGDRIDGMQLTEINLGGHKGFSAQGIIKQQGSLYTKMDFYLRGNQVINLALIGDSAKICSPDFKSMFSSFRFMPYKEEKWLAYNNDSLHFKTIAPAQFIAQEEKSYLHNHQVNSYDSISGTTYSIIMDTLSKYSYAISDSAYLVDNGAGYLSETDSIFSKHLNTGSAGSQYEIIYGHPQYNNRNRVKFILHGNLLYSLYMAGDRETVFSEQTNAMFNQVNISGTPSTFHLDEPKFAGWMKEVKSGNDTTISSILYSMGTGMVSKAYIPQLQKALITSYGSPALSAENQLSINNHLRTLLESLKDSTIVDFVKKEYPAIKDSAYSVNLLSILSNHKTQESYQLLNTLLLQYPPKFDLNYKLYRVSDSLQLGKWFYQNTGSLITNVHLGRKLTSLGIELCDSSLLHIADLRLQEKDFLALAEKVLPEIKKDSTAAYSYAYSGLLKILDTLNTPATNAALKKFLSLGNKSFDADVVIRLAKKGIPIPASNLEGLAADQSYRSTLYTELKEIGKVALFPKKWATPKSLSQSTLYAMASDDYEPSEVRFIKQKQGSIDGKKYLFFLFQVKFDSGESYLGVAGGYDLKGKGVLPAKDYSSIHWDEEFSQEAIDEQFANELDSNSSAEEE